MNGQWLVNMLGVPYKDTTAATGLSMYSSSFILQTAPFSGANIGVYWIIYHCSVIVGVGLLDNLK